MNVFSGDRKNRRVRGKIIVYILSMILVYSFIVSPLFSYSNLSLNINYKKMILAFGLLLLTFFHLPYDVSKPSTCLFYILYSITYCPTLTFYWLNNQSTPYIIVETICFLLIEFLIPSKGRKWTVRSSTGYIAIVLFFILYVISVSYAVYKNKGINIHISSILSKDLYDARADNNTSGLIGYLINWCAKSCTPFFFIFFLIKRNKLGIIGTLLAQLILFLSFGYKSYLLAIVVLIGVSYLMNKRKDFPSRWLNILIFGNVGALIFGFLGTRNPFSILYTCRTLFIPAQGQFEYYDFFSNHPFLYMSEGKIGSILGIKYPYNDTIGRVVNEYIYGPSKVSNGNTGAFSYGYADFGYIGMILAAIIIIIILRMVDSTTYNLPTIIPVTALAYQFIGFNDGNVMITVLTGGLFLSIILLVIMNTVYPDIIKRRTGGDTGRSNIFSIWEWFDE